MSKLLDALTKTLIDTYAARLDEGQKRELADTLEQLANLKKYNRFGCMFPDTGDCRRELYKKHMECIEAGANFRERLFMAGNRVGKSELGAYELTCHATGRYPAWWNGKRFNRPIKAWLGGDTSTTVRDILQFKLLGDFGDFGSGMLPKDCIISTTSRRNVPNAIETVRVKHITGGVSEITFKTYEQGRETWQGTEQDLIWMDEEPPPDVYAEALIRTMTTNGILLLTFTPLRGLSDVVLSFMENDNEATRTSSKHTTTATWNDVPHLTEQAKAELLAAIPPNERDARSKGVPVIGSGRIFPFSESEIVVADFQIPKFYAKAYALDVGWNKTAALWGALDRDADILYIYSEHYQGEQEPALHARAIKARGEWIKGVIDPAARGRSQVDGTKLIEMYIKEGLKITTAENAVEAGIYEVWTRMQTGRLKIFRSCVSLLKELALYHRDEKGRVVKKHDHLVDTLRYLCMSGVKVASYAVDTVRTKKNNVVNFSAWT